MQRLAALITTALLVLLMACGGGSSGGNDVTPTQLKLNMTTASALVGQTAQFSANVPVTWAVKETNGGSITTDGLYTAPRGVGAFHVIATAKSDTSQTATATVNISAKFAFIEEIQSGATPYSTTPILATMGTDASITLQNVIDDTTQKPVDTQMEDVALSPDGTKAVFTQLTYDVNLEDEYQAIWIANVDGSSLAQLTFPSSTTSFGEDRYPSFTPDGKSVLYSHQDSNGRSGSESYTSYSIRLIGIDGLNKQVIFEGNAMDSAGSSVANPYIWHASMSPDSKTVVAEVAYYSANMTWIDGIATLSTSGPSIVQLTGDPATMGCAGGYAYDEMPVFSNSPGGSVIVFSRICDSETAITETIMSMNPDGTSLSQLHGMQGLISCEPRAMADKIAFSSNVDNPATDWFDMYMMNLDGSSLQRISNNQLYDGFSIWWMNGNYTDTASARVLAHMKKISPLQQRVDHLKQIREHRKRR